MSPRAASRLETLGFGRVFDYVAGKADWMAAGLPVEGTEADRPRAASVVRRQVPTCRLEELVGEVRRRTGDAGWDTCVVVNDGCVVLGRLRKRELESSDPNAPAEQVMQSGPATFRPSAPLESVLERMRDRKLESLLITTPDGVLVGVAYRKDVERAIDAA
jgi:CBS domain-containing protein